MARSEQEKAEELLKKRRLAAKGLKESPEGKAIDPMEDFDLLEENAVEKKDRPADIAARTGIAGVVTRRSG